MINRILLVLVCILSFMLLLIKSSNENTTFFSNEIKIKIKDKNTNQVTEMSLEEYVIGVVAGEMPASFHEEALKAQAVAARTYALYKIENTQKKYHVFNDVSDQSYITEDDMQTKWKNDFNKYYNKIKEAVGDTSGVVMSYNNKIIESLYFSMSNGYTENAGLVFSEDKAYLQSVKSEYENSNLKNYEVTKTIDKKELCKKIVINCEKILIDGIELSASGRVNYITINNKKIKGTDFRKLLGLRSTDFTIKLNKDTVDITTRGYGHGVGMSQHGANEMSKNGFKYEEILNYFYQNIEIGLL